MVQEDVHIKKTSRYTNATVSCLSYNKETDVSKYVSLSSLFLFLHSHPSLVHKYHTYCKYCRHVFIVADLTKQKMVEMELEKYKDCLERLVRDRTLELQAKELE